MTEHNAEAQRLGEVADLLREYGLRVATHRGVNTVEYAKRLVAMAAPPQVQGAGEEAVGAACYRGNSVSYMYDRAKAYGDEIMRVWFVLKAAGKHPGRTDDPLHEVVRNALAAPVEAPAGGALTDERICELWSKAAEMDRSDAPTQQHWFARAIEAAHGIASPSTASGEQSNG